MLQTADGGYALAGVASLGWGDTAMCLIKTDAYGNVEWQRAFGGMDLPDLLSDGAYSMAATADGGYVLAGYTSSWSAIYPDAWLVKTDSKGYEMWNHSFAEGDPSCDCWDAVESVITTGDGGYVLAGESSTSTGMSDLDAFLIKTDANGNEVWNHTFGGPSLDRAYSVVSAADGGYVVAGVNGSSLDRGAQGWLIKTDANGNEVWSRMFGGEYNDAFYSVKRTADGGYILGGIANSLAMVGSDLWLLKTDGNGNEVWERTFRRAYTDFANSVATTADGGYIVAGASISLDTSRTDTWLIKTDGNGNKMWDRTFGGTGDESAGSVVQTTDGGYVLVGSPSSDVQGNGGIWMIKTDANGNAP